MIRAAPDLPACMGGWCAKRDHCPHFHSSDRSAPSERLCAYGAEEIGITFAVDALALLPSQVQRDEVIA